MIFCILQRRIIMWLETLQNLSTVFSPFFIAYVGPLYTCFSKNSVACRCKFISYLLVFADFISASCSMCIMH
jgi:hypothetical protein